MKNKQNKKKTAWKKKQTKIKNKSDVKNRYIIFGIVFFIIMFLAVFFKNTKNDYLEVSEEINQNINLHRHVTKINFPNLEK